MGTDKWIVNNVAGEEWGIIKRLILDSATRQISFADVVLADSGQLIRLPWENFEVKTQGITLRLPNGQVVGNAMSAQEGGSARIIAMDLWP